MRRAKQYAEVFVEECPVYGQFPHLSTSYCDSRQFSTFASVQQQPEMELARMKLEVSQDTSLVEGKYLRNLQHHKKESLRLRCFEGLSSEKGYFFSLDRYQHDYH